MTRVDGFYKGFIPLFFVAPLNSSLSLSFIPCTLFLSRSTLDWCVQVLLLSSLDPTQAPGTAAQLFSPRFFLCWELAQLQKSSPPALESCILYSIPAVARLRSVPCKDALAIFANPSSSICALRFPPPRDFFDVSSLLIAAPLLSYLKSTLSYFCAASCSLCTLSDPSSVVFPSGIMFCSCIVVWVRTLSFLPQKQHKPHFCCIGGFKINLMNIKTSFWFSQVVEFSLVKFLSPWYTQNPELLHSGLFVPSAEPCELFLSLFTWNKPQTPQ